MDHIDPPQHHGTSDATPGGSMRQRRPGELAFAVFLLITSLGLLWSAYGIENPFGSNGLSAPRSIPMATTFVMALTAAIILVRTAKRPFDHTQTIARDILPVVVMVFVLFLVAYGVLLRPLGFLPTSALFLVAAVKVLGKRSWGWTLAVSFASLFVIWLIFRIVFSVLMPSGIVPEAEFIQMLRNLVSGGAGQ